MPIRVPVAISVFFFLSLSAVCHDSPLWLRYPAISPGGQTIVFEYRGHIYSVPEGGGAATPLTLGEAYDFAPVWSHDGKQIAFASDRYGDFDVFVMPGSGGEARRLTFHSAREFPTTFTADDTAVLFSANRQPLASNAQFPLPAMSQLYSVPAAGGRVSQVLPVPAPDATLDSTGNLLIFDDVKGGENEWRKHHTSAVTRDIWVYDFSTKKYRQLTTFNGEDRNPVFAGNDKEFYYLSEQSGSFNIYRSSLADPAKTAPITHFSKHPVRFLTRSRRNLLCLSFDGQIYTVQPGGEPRLVSIRIAADGPNTPQKIVPVNAGFTEMSLSPNGKEFAYVFRGDIFVTNMQGGMTKRITATPWQERSVSFSPDGRSLVYAGERDNNWNVYTATIARKEEPYFFTSTVIKHEPVIATAAEEFQPAFSPDGKEIAYLEDRATLKVINLATKEVRTVMPADRNFSYRDGDQYYQWSPDGKWFLVQFGYPGRMFTPQIGLVSHDGKGEIHNLTLSGYNNRSPKWALGGAMMIWGSDREGARQQSGEPFGGDVYGMFFSKAAFDRFRLSKEELALLKEQEAQADQAKPERKDATTTPAAPNRELAVDWDNLTERKVRLTTHTSPAGDWLLSKDGERLFYLTRFEKGNDLWVTDLRTQDTKLLAKLGASRASMEISKDGKFILVASDGRPIKVDAESGKAEPVRCGGEMALDPAAERNDIFDHAWRLFKQKFYVTDLQGVDWDFYYREYRKFLPFINNNYDFAEMLSEMFGEVNASHSGCRYVPGNANADQTAELGLLYDFSHTGNGVKVAEVVAGGPLDKAASRIRAGHIIEMIDGQPLTAAIDFYQLLNRKVGKLTLLSGLDPVANIRWEETVKPISGEDEGQLLYLRWVRNRRAEVERLSGGAIGYVHVRAMNDASMRTVFEEALGRYVDKQALIVDTRFNAGGNLHEQLSDFLSGKKYFDLVARGQSIRPEPYQKWLKPSIVLINEAQYSDGHLFPVAYKLKGIGQTLGMPVPGTGTSGWFDPQVDPTLMIGLPLGGWITPDGKICENTQFEPDIKVRNEPDALTAGRDQQIETAVKELMKNSQRRAR